MLGTWEQKWIEIIEDRYRKPRNRVVIGNHKFVIFAVYDAGKFGVEIAKRTAKESAKKIRSLGYRARVIHKINPEWWEVYAGKDI